MESNHVSEIVSILISSQVIEDCFGWEESYRHAYKLASFTHKKLAVDPFIAILSDAIHKGSTTLLIKNTWSSQDCRAHFDKRVGLLHDILMYWARTNNHSREFIDGIAEASWILALKEVRDARYQAVLGSRIGVGLQEDLTCYITNMSLP